MEEPRNSETVAEKQKLVITVGSGGGIGIGIGVGIVFLGGVMATAAFAFLSGRRRHRKSTGDDHSTVRKDFDAIQEDMDPNLSAIFRNGSSSSYARVDEEDGSTISISEESFLRKKARLELNGGKEDSLSNDEDVVHFDEESNLQFDGGEQIDVDSEDHSALSIKNGVMGEVEELETPHEEQQDKGITKADEGLEVEAICEETQANRPEAAQKEEDHSANGNPEDKLREPFFDVNEVEVGGEMLGKGLQKGSFDVDKGSLKSSLIRTYVEQLAGISQRTPDSHRRRILVFTALVLSGWLRFWYFSRPFLKQILNHFRNYLMIKLHLMIRSSLRSHLKFNLVPKMLGI